MAIQYTIYGTMAEAETYFANRLHSGAWDRASAETRRRALIGATNIIDTLAYKGSKAAVCTLLAADPDATDAEIRAAEATQYHEFPRGEDTDTPDDIVRAAYEIAFSLLDGKDPEMELEAMGISSQGIESVRTTYARQQLPIEHIINGVPNALAWRLIRPFLRDGKCIQIIRV